MNLKQILTAAGLYFENPEDERKFAKTLRDPAVFRSVLIKAVIIYLMFAVFDYLLFPQYFFSFFTIRFGGILPFLSLLFVLTYGKNYEKYVRGYVCGGAIGVAYSLILMEFIARGSEYSGLYFYSLSLVLIFFHGTGTVTIMPSVVTGILVVLPGVWVDMTFVEQDMRISLYKFFFLVATYLGGVFVTSVIQKSLRNRFRLLQRIEQLSLTDSLTGVHNRHYFETVIRNEIINFINASSRREKTGQRHKDRLQDKLFYGICLIDIDYFKQINDTHGHECGDIILQELCNRIRKTIRKQDICIRWGGEEFLIILKNINKASATDSFKRIQTVVSSIPFEAAGNSLNVTISGGLHMIRSESIPDFSNVDALINIADNALYHAKANGRNQFVMAREEGIPEE